MWHKLAYSPMILWFCNLAPEEGERRLQAQCCNCPSNRGHTQGLDQHGSLTSCLGRAKVAGRDTLLPLVWSLHDEEKRGSIRDFSPWQTQACTGSHSCSGPQPQPHRKVLSATILQFRHIVVEEVSVPILKLETPDRDAGPRLASQCPHG